MNNIFKKGFYILAALVLGFATSCDDDDTELAEIAGLDFVIATLNLEGNEIGVVPTTVNSNNRIVYSVDFGATPGVDTDIFATSGPMVTFEYPNEDGTYTITVTASLEGASDVSITKEVTITEYIAPTIPTGPGNPIAGTWRIAQELGSLAVGPGLLDGTGDPWWSADDEALADRTCLWDDEYVFNEDGTFENVLQGETWLEQIGEPGVSCYGVDTAGCGPTVFPYDGSASATYEFNEATESLTLTGRGAFLGLSKVINGGEVCPSDAADSLTYIASFNDEGALEVFIQTDAGNDAYWYYKLVKE